MDEMILHIAVAVLPLLAGWILDRLFGDPACLPHPVVGYGKVISFFEHRLNKGSDRRLKGALMSLSLVLSVFGIVRLLLWLLSPYPYVRIAIETAGVF